MLREQKISAKNFPLYGVAKKRGVLAVSARRGWLGVLGSHSSARGRRVTGGAPCALWAAGEGRAGATGALWAAKC
jgi:hypothetical protein